MAFDEQWRSETTPLLASGTKRSWRAPTVIVSTADATEKVASSNEIVDGNSYGPS